MTEDSARRAWLHRVLGVQWPADAAPRSRPPLMPLWRQAKEAVDDQLQRLEQALRASGLRLATAIADHGLVGALGPDYIRLMALLLDCDLATGPDWQAAAERAAQGVQRMRSQLAASPALTTLERNPLGVPVQARGMLGTALDQIDAVLRQR